MIKASLEGIRVLAKSDHAQQAFCDRLLPELANVVGAEAGIIWDVNSQTFRVVSQYSASDQPARLSLTKQDHDRLLADAVHRNSPILVRASESDEPAAAAPMLLVGKFSRNGRYLIELMAADSRDEDATKRQMQQFGTALKIISDTDADGSSDGQTNLPSSLLEGLAAGLVSPNALMPNAADGLPTESPSTSRTFSQDELSSYLSAIHRSIDLKTASANIANETRRLLDCDRVSVLVRHQGRYRVFAISGQPSVNRRSNTTRLLEELSRRLLKTGQSFWYPDEAEIPSQISGVLDEYLAISATRSLILVPVFEKAPTLVEDPESLESKRNRVIGGIVFEHCHERWERSVVEPTIGLAADHGGNALRNAAAHQQLFLYPLWKLLGQSRLLTAPRMLTKTVMVTLGLILACLFLAFWKVDFYVTADGTLMPERHKPVFSSADGEIDRLFVKHGSSVEVDDTLAILVNHEHRKRVQDVAGQLRTAEQRLESIRDRRVTKKDAEDATQENIVSLQAQIRNFQDQQAVLDDISESLIIKSPLAGQVITWDLQRLLDNRTVNRGNELMEIADVNGEWELIMDLPVQRYGHLQQAIEAGKDPSEFNVSMLLAADTTRRLTGHIKSIDSNTALNANKEQVIRIRASIETDGITIDQVRTGVTAKIYCGRTSIGYQWLHPIQEFLTKHVFFKIQ